MPRAFALSSFIDTITRFKMLPKRFRSFLPFLLGHVWKGILPRRCNVMFRAFAHDVQGTNALGEYETGKYVLPARSRDWLRFRELATVNE